MGDDVGPTLELSARDHEVELLDLRIPRPLGKLCGAGASSHWTTCRNFGETTAESGAAVEPAGPLYAIVCEVKDGGGAYGDIPYFDGVRVDTVRTQPGGDTVVRFTDAGGTRHEFASVAEYLAFYEKSGRPW